MAAPWLRTIERLAVSTNGVAISVLTAGLRGPNEVIAAACLGALLRKNSSRVNFEVLRTCHTFPPAVRLTLERSLALLSGTVRQAIQHGEPQVRDNALDLIRRGQDIQQLPLLLTLIELSDEGVRDRAIEVSRLLVDTLYMKLYGGPDPATETFLAGHPAFRDVARVRQLTIAALEAACQRYESHHCLEVVEWLAALGDLNDLSTRRVFTDRQTFIPEVLRQVLSESHHPGVTRLLLKALEENYPALWLMRILVERQDPEFACEFLRFLPRKPPSIMARNLREIRALGWLDSSRLSLASLPPALHVALVTFTTHSGLSSDARFSVLEWIVREGSPQGRMAATELLCRMEDDKVQEVVLESLESEVPNVQAWATTQLRSREVPHCFEMLIERLDSPHEEVRVAARTELSDFGVPRVLELFTELDAARCRAIGLLLLKIDPDAPDKFHWEMTQAVRRRRIRAAHCAEAIGLLPRVIDGLVEMAQDSDTLVRRTAIEAIAKLDGPRAEGLLSMALSDISPRVREVAERSLAARGTLV
jgi:HEAT repeat protein